MPVKIFSFPNEVKLIGACNAREVNSKICKISVSTSNENILKRRPNFGKIKIAFNFSFNVNVQLRSERQGEGEIDHRHRLERQLCIISLENFPKLSSVSPLAVLKFSQPKQDDLQDSHLVLDKPEAILINDHNSQL